MDPEVKGLALNSRSLKLRGRGGFPGPSVEPRLRRGHRGTQALSQGKCPWPEGGKARERALGLPAAGMGHELPPAALASALTSGSRLFACRRLGRSC